jgi:hypothetical protein
VSNRQELPELDDTLQLAGTLASEGNYPGTMFGFVRIAR